MFEGDSADMFSAHVYGGPSRGSRVRRHRSEDPHRLERKFKRKFSPWAYYYFGVSLYWYWHWFDIRSCSPSTYARLVRSIYTTQVCRHAGPVSQVGRLDHESPFWHKQKFLVHSLPWFRKLNVWKLTCMLEMMHVWYAIRTQLMSLYRSCWQLKCGMFWFSLDILYKFFTYKQIIECITSLILCFIQYVSNMQPFSDRK